MKHILFFLLLPFLGVAQITVTPGNSVPISTDKILYIDPTIYVIPTVMQSGDIRCYVLALPATGASGYTYMDFTASYLNGLTPSGATTTAKFLNVCAQAVELNLISYFGSDIFTNTY